MAHEDHEMVLRAVIRAGMVQQGADVASFPGGGGGALSHERGGQQLAPLGPEHHPRPLALPPAEPGAAAAPAPPPAAAQVTAAPGNDGPGRWAQGGGEGPATRDTPPAGPGPPIQSPPPTTPVVSATEGRVPPPVGERAGAASARTRVARRPRCLADR